MDSSVPHHANQQDHPFRITNEDAVTSPGLLLYPDRIRRNLQAMLQWTSDASLLRPHVKTHKLPQIIQMKLDAGITKFKTATLAETKMTAQAGGLDVLWAYPCVGPNIDKLIELIESYPQTQFSTLVDDAATARALSQRAKAANVTIHVYVDLNVGMNRTGVHPSGEALGLYQTLSELDHVHIQGLHAYDGHLHETDSERLAKQLRSTFEPVWRLTEQIESVGLPRPKIVGCGTPSSKWMGSQGAANRYPIEVGAGTSVLWDAGQPTFTPELAIENAAVLLCRVISKPTPQSLCLDLGYKAVASEMQPPRATFFELPDAKWLMHSEEHLVLQSEQAAKMAVGDVVYAIPWHICPTVALYDSVWCVEQNIAKEKWPVTARTRSL